MPLTVADNYDAELRRLNDRFCATTGIRRIECVLDIGCGAEQSSRAAVAGKVLGVDISEPVLEPVFYGRVAESAYEIVCSMSMTRDVLARLGSSEARSARARLR